MLTSLKSPRMELQPFFFQVNVKCNSVCSAWSWCTLFSIHQISTWHASDKSTLFFIFTPSSGPRPWPVWAVTTVLELSVGCGTCMCISIGGLQLHVVGVACCVAMLLQNFWCLTVLKKKLDVEVGTVDWNVVGKRNDCLNEKRWHSYGRAVSSSTVSVGQQSGCFCDCWNVSCKQLICRFLVCLCVGVFSILISFFLFLFCILPSVFSLSDLKRKREEKKHFLLKANCITCVNISMHFMFEWFPKETCWLKWPQLLLFLVLFANC